MWLRYQHHSWANHLMGLLNFGWLNGIMSLQVFSDSWVIINYTIGLYNLQVLHLDEWCKRVQILMAGFSSIVLSHIYINFYNEVDSLSKCVVDLLFNTFSFEDFIENTMVSTCFAILIKWLSFCFGGLLSYCLDGFCLVSINFCWTIGYICVIICSYWILVDLCCLMIVYEHIWFF